MASDRDRFDDAQRPGDDENPLAEFMRQFGIQPGPDGKFDLNQLMGSLQQAMNQFTAHMNSFGDGSSGGLNWDFTKDIARKVTAAAGADPSPTASGEPSPDTGRPGAEGEPLPEPDPGGASGSGR